MREEYNARNGERVAGDANRGQMSQGPLCHGQSLYLILRIQIGEFYEEENRLVETQLNHSLSVRNTDTIDGQGIHSQVEESAPIWRWEELSHHVDKTQLSGIKEGSSTQESVYKKSSHLVTCLLTQPHLAFDLIYLQTFWMG